MTNSNKNQSYLTGRRKGLFVWRPLFVDWGGVGLSLGLRKGSNLKLQHLRTGSNQGPSKGLANNNKDRV